MSKFKVGDRVALYTIGGRRTGVVKFIGTVSGELDITLDGTGYNTTVHYKQCRRLKRTSVDLDALTYAKVKAIADLAGVTKSQVLQTIIAIEILKEPISVVK